MTKVLLQPGHDMWTTQHVWRLSESVDTFAIAGSKISRFWLIPIYSFIGIMVVIAWMIPDTVGGRISLAIFLVFASLVAGIAFYQMWKQSHELAWLIIDKKTGIVSIPRIELTLNIKQITNVITVTEIRSGGDLSSDVYLDTSNDVDKRMLVKLIGGVDNSAATLGKALAEALNCPFVTRKKELGEPVEFITIEQASPQKASTP